MGAVAEIGTGGDVPLSGIVVSSVHSSVGANNSDVASVSADIEGGSVEMGPALSSVSEDLPVLVDDPGISVTADGNPDSRAWDLSPVTIPSVDAKATTLGVGANDPDLVVGADVNIISSSWTSRPFAATGVAVNLSVLVDNTGLAVVSNSDSDGRSSDLGPSLMVGSVDAVSASLDVGADDPDLSSTVGDVVGGTWSFLPSEVGLHADSSLLVVVRSVVLGAEFNFLDGRRSSKIGAVLPVVVVVVLFMGSSANFPVV